MKFKYYEGSVTVLQNITNYEEARAKITNTQLSEVKYATTYNETYISLYKRI